MAHLIADLLNIYRIVIERWWVRIYQCRSNLGNQMITCWWAMWSLKAFEGQGLRARLCCRKISDSIFWLHCFTSRWLAGAMPCQKKVPKEMYKKKRQKQIRDENISSILSYIYLVKGLTDATSQDVAWCPKHQTAKWCCWFDGHCLKERDDIVFFSRRKSFFLLRMHHLLFC